MPPVSRFGGGDRTAKKQSIIDKFKVFFERFFGIGGGSFEKKDNTVQYTLPKEGLGKVAEDSDKGSYVYVEPEDYFPKELRKKYKLGEYNDEED